MGGFINFAIEFFNKKKSTLYPHYSSVSSCGEDSALFVVGLLFFNAQPHAWHIMDIMKVLDEGLGPGTRLQGASISWSPREQARARCVSWGVSRGRVFVGW